MGKRNQAEPDARKTRASGKQDAAKSGKEPDAAAGKPAPRKPAAAKAAPAKPSAEKSSATPKKSAPRKPAAEKPVAPAKRAAPAKPAASTRAAAAKPEKKAPARRAATLKTPPASVEPLAEPQSGYLPAAPPTYPPASSLQPVASSLQPAASSLQPAASSLQPVASSLQPAASSLQPAASSLQPVASSLQPAAASSVSRVVLMIRDPEWLYGYWEISEADQAAHAIGQPQGAPPLLLRVLDQGEGAEPAPTGEFFDVNVIPDASGWYIRVPAGGGHWSAALGYINYEGAFVSLAQSNVVTTPRPLYGEWNEQAWGPVSAEKESELTEAAGLTPPAAEEYGPDGQTRFMRRASRLMAYLRGLGASEQVPYFGASEQVPFPGASERFGASEQAARQPGGIAVMEKTFWLQVHTELIVYGATEPDAKVTVQGVPILLRPDGTFTLRFALPDGEQVIPVHAVNADGDMERTITPIVKKRTV